MADCNRFDLDEEFGTNHLSLDGGARRRGLGEILRADLVHRGVVGNVLQKNDELYDIGQCSIVVREQFAHALEDLVSLSPHVTDMRGFAIGVDASDARNEDQRRHANIDAHSTRERPPVRGVGVHTENSTVQSHRDIAFRHSLSPRSAGDRGALPLLHSVQQAFVSAKRLAPGGDEFLEQRPIALALHGTKIVRQFGASQRAGRMTDIKFVDVGMLFVNLAEHFVLAEYVKRVEPITADDELNRLFGHRAVDEVAEEADFSFVLAVYDEYISSRECARNT